MRIKAIHIIGILAAVIAGVLSFIYLHKSLRYFVMMVALVLAVLPFVITFVHEQRKQKEKEEMFLAFSRDLVENVKSGTPVSKSILNVRKRDYGSLTPYVKKLANQITLGIPLSDALQTFAKETESPIIQRAIGLIAEAEKAGGQIESILQSVTKSINQVENLRKERKASVSNLVTQGYIIFIVFIVIMLVMQFKIFPLVLDLGSAKNLHVGTQTIKNPQEFSRPMFIMLLIQSLFAGLVIGKVSEGSIFSGIKHSFVLVAIALLTSSGAQALFGK